MPFLSGDLIFGTVSQLKPASPSATPPHSGHGQRIFITSHNAGAQPRVCPRAADQTERAEEGERESTDGTRPSSADR
ncbi:hypothetical protein AAFF_G00122120 [Aldrovandia affinis]|uniref:Uncharacterized protein n=1 Tax=Aldrovandia affinis TaxID=143900 RepID=A0AAD7RRX4_9TELE|nr:hypothetical protein AAFF_G00122120 [Aldrovandia affinis]